ncbi:unnamed protein product, partial [marine sediment metagenome]
LFDHLTALGNVETGLVKVKRMDKDKARQKAIEELRQRA